MQDSLRLLEEKEANSKLQALRNLLIQGDKSGDAGELSMESIKLEAKKEASLLWNIFNLFSKIGSFPKIHIILSLDCFL